jgi:hypothetical protein
VRAVASEYADYHRTIIGFHGTTEEVANRLVEGKPFRASDSIDDWLGRGIYFWEWAPKQAWWWTRTFKKNDEPAVVGAIIRLGNCFDLLDPINVKKLKTLYKELIDKLEDNGEPIPENFRQHRKLDCAVFNYFYEIAEAAEASVDSVRGVYVPTSDKKRVWSGSWIYDDAHIQICLRNPNNILAVWHVRPDGRYGKTQS